MAERRRTSVRAAAFIFSVVAAALALTASAEQVRAGNTLGALTAGVLAGVCLWASVQTLTALVEGAGDGRP